MNASPHLLSLIRSANEDRGVKLAWLADQAGYAPQILSRIRDGHRPPADLNRLFALVTAAGGDLADRTIVLQELADFDAARAAEKAAEKAASGIA